MPAKPKVPQAPVPTPKPSRATAKTPPPVAAAPEVTPAVGEMPPPREEKQKKTKMVRDSFTIPEREYAVLGELKRKCLKSGVHVKKSELLRAGLASLAGLSDVALIAAVGQVEVIKTGRPKKS